MLTVVYGSSSGSHGVWHQGCYTLSPGVLQSAAGENISSLVELLDNPSAAADLQLNVSEYHSSQDAQPLHGSTHCYNLGYVSASVIYCYIQGLVVNS